MPPKKTTEDIPCRLDFFVGLHLSGNIAPIGVESTFSRNCAIAISKGL